MLHSQLSASSPLPFIATVICLLDVVHGAAINSNATIVLPPPLSNHGDPRLICRPTKWTDVIAFYLANYVLHIATVQKLPGESRGNYVVAALLALLIPTTGMARGMRAVFNRPIFGKSPLQKAARAQALYQVVELARDEANSDDDGDDDDPEQAKCGFVRSSPQYRF